MRDDYEQLIHLLKKNNQIHGLYEGVGIELNNGDLPFIKIINRNIAVSEIKVDDCREEANLWIDIFPLDGVPSKNTKRFFRSLFIYRKLIAHKLELTHHWQINRSPLNKVYIWPMHFLLKALSLKRLVQNFVSVCSSKHHTDTDYICNCVWGIGQREAFPKKLFEETIDCTFEGHSFKAMKGTEQWLKIRYGDYMKLPDEKDRINHGLRAWKVDRDEK